MFFRMMEESADSDMSDEKRILAQFKSESGDVTGNAFDLPLNITAEKLQLICNAMLTNVGIPFTYCV
jgi:ribosome assembly protein 4